VEIVEHLAHERAGRILAVEPHVKALPAALAKFGDRVCLTELAPALQEADVVVLLVNHRSFAAIDRALLKAKVAIDTRGFWR
jgi:UDP-N-acetyl-D-mannosaminuronic acid dehydrogenase